MENEINIFTDKGLIEEITFEKTKLYLERLKNNDMDNIKILLNNLYIQVEQSYIISNILNNEILEKNKLILILIDIYLNEDNEINESIIIETIYQLQYKIMIKREYFYFICQKIRKYIEEGNKNENFIIKCINIFTIFFLGKQLNLSNISVSDSLFIEKTNVISEFENYRLIPKKLTFDYFSFYNLKEGLIINEISNFSLNNSFFTIIFKIESYKNFSLLIIEINDLLNLDISIQNKELIIKVNEKEFSFMKENEIKVNKFYVLEIQFLISDYTDLNNISQNNFKVELKSERKKKSEELPKNIFVKEDKQKSNNDNKSYKITLLKNFSGLIKSIFFSKTKINNNESLFDITNYLNYYFIISPLSYNNNIIIEPINNYQIEIKDTFLNQIINKQNYFSFIEKIEILLPILEIVYLNNFENAAQNLFELFDLMFLEKKKKKNFKKANKYIKLINKFIEFSNINWIREANIKNDEFLSLFLIKNINEYSKEICEKIFEKIEKKNVISQQIKLWLFYGGKVDFINLKDIIFPKLVTKILENENNLKDIFYLYSKNPNSFLFLFLLITFQSKECYKYYDLIRKNKYFYLLYFYFQKGKFNDLFLNDNITKNQITIIFIQILNQLYPTENDLNKSLNDLFIKNEFLYILKPLLKENINNNEDNKDFNLFKYIEDIIEKENIETVNKEQDQPITLFLPKEFNMKTDLIHSYKEHLKYCNFYKKIKKRLFFWNGPYSNYDIFFNQNKENVLELKFKSSNHLTQELTLPLLVPIANIDDYLPIFSKFKKEKMFKSSFDKIYKLNLYPFYYFYDKFSINFFNFDNQENKSDLEYNVCHIKPLIHDKGFIEINKKNILFYSYPYYINNNDNDNYDTERKSCYGCLFNLKEKNSKILRYKKIKINNIKYYIVRKYLFEKNAIEIFTNNNKSYYFQFQNVNQKDNFIEKIKEINNQIVQFTKNKFVDEWKKGYMSNFEYIMNVNLLGNRSYRDLSQYPVFPWLIKDNDIILKEDIEEIKIDEKLNNDCDDDIQRKINLKIEKNIEEKKEDNKLEEKNEENKLEEKNEENKLEEKKEEIKLEEKKEEIKLEEKKEKEKKEEKSNFKFRKEKMLEKDNNKLEKKKIEYKIIKREYFSSKVVFEKILLNLRPLSLPMGLLDYCEKNKKRKKLYIKNFEMGIEQINEEINYNKPFIRINKKEEEIPIYDRNIKELYENPDIPIDEIPYVFGSHYSNQTYVTHYLVRIFPFTISSLEIQGNSFDSPDRLFININKSFIGSSTEKGDIRELIPQFFFLPEMFINLNKFNFGFLQKVGLEKTDSTIFIQNLFNLGNEVNNCLIPYYADNDPYKFIIIYRKVLESAKIKIEDWINFIFGEFSYGKKAQDKGNIFMSYCYDGVVEKRIKENKSLKRICCRLNELGCNPLNVFDKVIKRNYYLEVNYPFNIPFKTEEGTFSNIISLNCFVNESTLNVNLIYKNNKLLSCDLQINLKGQICNVSLTQIKDYVSFESNNIINVFKNQQKFIITDYYKICYIYINNFFSKNKTEYIKIKEVITVLTLSKDEEYLFLGTKCGRIIIFNIANEKFQIIKKISAHDKPINFIHDNNILNMFVSCSNDCNINLYLYPNIQLVRVIKVNENFIPHYSFLSSDPLSSIIVYSNSNNKFLCYSLNGKLLLEKNRDDEIKLFKEKQYNEYNQVFKLPCTVRLNDFNDYLVYFNNDFIVFRKLPFLEIAFYILNQKNKVADNFKVFNIN